VYSNVPVVEVVGAVTGLIAVAQKLCIARKFDQHCASGSIILLAPLRDIRIQTNWLLRAHELLS